jgi:hypothetical protein
LSPIKQGKSILMARKLGFMNAKKSSVKTQTQLLSRFPLQRRLSGDSAQLILTDNS